MALSLNKNRPELYELRAMIYLKRNEYEKVLRNLDQIELGRLERTGLLFGRAVCRKILGQYSLALQDYDIILKGNPVDVESIKGKAECLFNLNRLEEAMEAANRGLKLNAVHEDLLRCAVDIELRRENYEPAVMFANRLVSASGCAAYTYDMRANALEGYGELDRALKDRRQAVELVPTASGYWNSLALLYAQTGNNKEALKCYNKAIKLNPQDAKLRINRGVTFEEKGDFEKAFNDFDLAVSLDGNNADSYYFRARNLFDMGEMDKCERDINMAIKLADKDPFSFYLRGKVHEKRKDLAGALSDYSQAIVLDQEFAPAYKRRGAVYFDLGEKAKAHADSIKAHELQG